MYVYWSCVVTVESGRRNLASQDTADIFAEILERVRRLDPVNNRKWFDDLSEEEQAEKMQWAWATVALLHHLIECSDDTKT